MDAEETPSEIKSCPSRADLIRALDSGGASSLHDVAHVLGFEYRTPKEASNLIQELSLSGEAIGNVDSAPTIANEHFGQNLAMYLVVGRHSFRQTEMHGDSEQASEALLTCPGRGTHSPRHRPLATRDELQIRLDSLLTRPHKSRRVDNESAVERIAHLRPLEPVPRQDCDIRSGTVVAILDYSRRLTSYRQDFEVILEALWDVCDQEPRILYVDDYLIPARCPETQQTTPWSDIIDLDQVLVVSDLGELAVRDQRPNDYWKAWLSEAACLSLPVALLTPQGFEPRCVAENPALRWEPLLGVATSRPASKPQQASIQLMLTLLSHATLVDPWLLRAVRQMLPETRNEPGFESLLLQQRELSEPNGYGSGWREIPKSFRRQFAIQPKELQNEFVQLLEQARDLQPVELLAEEMITLAALDVCAKDSDLVKWAVSYFKNALQEWEQAESADAIPQGDMAWRIETAQRLPDDAHFVDDAIRQFCNVKGKDTNLRSQEFNLVTDDAGITVFPKSPHTGISQPTDPICSSDGIFKITELYHLPDFISNYGRDGAGAWFEFQLPAAEGKSQVVQRMRWIRAGTFLMGSPPDEPERDDDELQHEVRLTRGFWLADTACTQALWNAVMDKNPSHFSGPQRPVETVSYDEVLEFFEKTNALFPGLELGLPTEAQWEYGCRAGTTTPFNTGNQITTNQANYHGIHPYVGGKQGEYREETVDVKALAPNQWGLYQMHGNVREWCRDSFRFYSAESQEDPLGPESGSNRIIRGGSWNFSAGSLRSAYRSVWRPGNRSGNLGFRCVSSARAEPVVGAVVAVAEQAPQQTRTGGAGHVFKIPINKESAEPVRVPLGRAAAFKLRSNLEELSLVRTSKPDWATAWGRDRYDVYADFQLTVPQKRFQSFPEKTLATSFGKSIGETLTITQRLRWIPPGQFMMGSPDEEMGRIDCETQHLVTLTTGYWIFDTPCTQALWMAVMEGDNPSKFADPLRPVEQVDWDASRDFAQRISNRLSGLNFTLPTEAQWEYACRGGTQTAIYSGPLEILSEANAPALEPIAWFCGNSGHEFELENGQDISDLDWFKNGPHNFTEAGTRRVATKKPNPWGLYDMLGNVHEWCTDWYDSCPVKSRTDPTGSESGSPRVIRGGGWGNDAGRLRSAYRYYWKPGDPGSALGFRCVSSASPGDEQSSAPSRRQGTWPPGEQAQ